MTPGLGGLESRIRAITIPFTDKFLQKLLGLDNEAVARLAKTANYRPISDTAEELLTKDEANLLIRDLISINRPFLVSRFGSVELKVVLRSLNRRNRDWLEKLYGLLAMQESPIWVPWEHRKAKNAAGFFSVDRKSTESFASLYLHASQNIDVLGSWVPGENQLSTFLKASRVTTLDGINPIGAAHPWTTALEGKKVLVIHPFARSVESQYQRREELFADPAILPKFELKTLKAIQSIGGDSGGFKSWFEALEHMHAESRKIDFDVAIIGCGAYGFPLGSMIKEDGKSAVVLGGATQLLFGIRGSRWSSSELFRDSWVFPLEEEKPKGYRAADRGAYW